ncbi:unnamed protein product [Parajaminaea phylloscopi]
MRLACGLVVAALVTAAAALTEQIALDFETYIPRLGSPIASNSIPALSPRFHRILGHTHEGVEAGKAQTALFSVTDTNVVGAVNPRNGAIVWRQHIQGPVQGLYTDADLAVVVSGAGGERIEMFHALTGFSLWGRQLLPPGSGRLSVSNDTQREAIPGSEVAWIPVIGQPRYDVVVLSNSDIVRRIDTDSGKDLWSYSRTQQGKNSAIAPTVRILTTSSTHVHVLSLEPAGSDTFGLEHQVLSAQNGALLYSTTIPGVAIDRTRGAADVLLFGLNPKVTAEGQSTATPPEPHVVWRQNDGTVKSSALALPPLSAGQSFSPKKTQPQSVTARDAADPFTELRPVRMADHGYLVAVRRSGRGEVIQLEKSVVKGGPRKLYSLWEFEEEAHDAVYSGNFDRQGSPYINRVYFSTAQHLLNFHVFWAHTDDGQGQVTGFSFRWDHDMHGDVLACPFEVSPVSAYQLVTRAGFATKSGALQMIQEDRHQWINEEGLTGTQHVAFVDLPRRARPSGSDVSSEEALQLLQRESFASRVLRHGVTLQALPEKVLHNLQSIWKSTAARSAAAATVSGATSKVKEAASMASSAATGAQASIQYDDLPPRPPRGGLPARDIAPPKNAGPNAAAAPGLSKKERTKAVNEARVAEEKPIDSVAPRTLTAEEASHNFYSDKWGLRQLMLSATTYGKIYAQDTGMKGQFVWEKSLVGFGLGEGKAAPRVNVKFLGTVRELQVKEGKQLDPLVYVVAEVGADPTGSPFGADKVAQVWELDPLTGEFVDGAMTGRPIFVGSVKDVRKVKGQETLAIVDSQQQVHLWPQTPSSARDFAASQSILPFHHTEVNDARTRMTGHALRDSNATASNVLPLSQRWQWDLPEGERVVAVHASSVLTDAPIAAQGRDLNDWFLTKMPKLLDPAALVVVTFSAANQLLTVHLVDQSTGNILHSLQAPDAGQIDLSRGAHVTFEENWLTLAYNVRDPQQDVNGGRVLSVEYYDSSFAAERPLSNWFVKSITPQANINSKDAKARGKAIAPRAKQVKVFSKSFMLPSELEGLGSGGTGVTETLHGASDKGLLLLTGSEELIMVPRKLLDPRRPLPKGSVSKKQTREEADSMLPVYDGMLTFDEKRVLTHSMHVVGSASAATNPIGAGKGQRAIFSRRTKLESTTLVGIHGHGVTDSFLTKVTTGGDFDLLSGTFNKMQLLVTTGLLGLGFVATRPLVKGRSLKARWL